MALLCCENEQLERYALGTLPERDAFEVEAHLDRCHDCFDRLERLETEDDWVSAVKAQARTAAALPESERFAVSHLMAALRVMLSAKTVSLGDTPADARLDFLLPSHAADELGRLGAYRVLGVLGQGGMGLVLRAADPDLLRFVALKVMKPSIAGRPGARERFLREARAAAKLAHDHVVPIYHVGEEQGTPFLAMPLLSGESLEERLHREPPLTVAEILRIGRETAEGLAAAHASGLIHRDIKPANLWLERGRAGDGESGGQGDDEAKSRPPVSPSPRLPLSSPPRVKILDFGLVLPEASQLSTEHAVLGTPEYMAPEQAAGAEVDGRSDLFSLGCVLYRLSTGVSPFQAANVMATLSALATRSPRPPREINPAIPTRLNDLILRLLAKRPQDRPASAREVVAALQAMERPPSPPARIVGVLAAALSVVLSVVAFRAAPVVYRFVTNQGEVVVEADDPGLELKLLRVGTETFATVRANRRATLAAGEYRFELPAGKHAVWFSRTQVTVRRGRTELVTVRRVAEDQARLGLTGDATDGKLLVSQSGRPVTFIDLRQRGTVALSPGTYQLALENAPAELRLSATQITLAAHESLTVTTHVVGEIRQYATGEVRSVAVAPDGARFVVATGDAWQVWDLGAEKPSATWQDTGKVEAAVFVGAPEAVRREPPGVGTSDVAPPDGSRRSAPSRLAFGDGPFVRLWDLDASRELHRLEGHAATPPSDRPNAERVPLVRCLACSPNGQTVASVADDDRVIRRWDIATGQPRPPLAGHASAVRCLTFSPDGKRLLSGGFDGSVRVWDAVTGAFQREQLGHIGPIRCLSVSPDGRLAVSGGSDNVARVWEIESGKDVSCFRGHEPDPGHPVSSVAFAPDGRHVLSAGGPAVCWWDATTGEERHRIRHERFVASVALLPDGRRFLAGGRDGVLRLEGLPIENPKPK